MLGERLKLARRMAGLNLRDVAARVGVSAQAISKYERDQDVPSSGVLLRLAQALNVPVHYFLRPPRLGRIVPAYRRHATLPRKQEASLLAHVHDWLERYLAIEDLTPEQHQFTWPAGFPYPVTTPDDAEHAAVALRHAWQVGLDPIENLTELLEDRGIKVGLVSDASGKFDACSFRAELDGDIPVVTVSGRVPGDRQRFSIAHELGHLALRMQAGADAEKLAHRFAGAFLVPESVVTTELGEHRHDLHPYELHMLKHKYGLSMQAWIRRAQDVGVLSVANAQRLYKQFSTNGWRKNEPGDACPSETPTRMTRLIMRAFSEDVISERRAAELLGMPLTVFINQVAEMHGGLPTGLRD